jgi:membrane protein YdbS with pleckstrin-like domain
MYEPLRRGALALLKVPPEPHPPVGDPASLQVFRAGRNYLRLRLAAWAVAQGLALAGIVFWTAVLVGVEARVRAEKSAPTNLAPEAIINPVPPDGAQSPAAENTATGGRRRPGNWGERFSEKVTSVAEGVGSAGKQAASGEFDVPAAYKHLLQEISAVVPSSAFPWIWALKILGFTLYLLQIPLTYAVRRLDYEMRWYMVTDRSLRLRHGVWKVAESTMSFANIQQVVVTHGPVQRLLGLGDVKVQSAGGGGGSENAHQKGEDMHVGLFHSVTNATAIRDLIVERLRRYREAGLGDPDERTSMATKVDLVQPQGPTDALAAAHEVLHETRALRSALARSA